MRSVNYIKITVVLLLLVLLISCGESKQERASRLAKEGDDYIFHKKHNMAIQKWEESILLIPENSALLKKIGDAYLHLTYINSALKAYEDALAIEPNAKEILLGISKIHLMQFELKSAQKVLELLLVQNHRDHRIYILNGDLFVFKSDLYAAEEEYRKALSIDPNNPTALIKLSTCLFAQGNVEAAYKMYDLLDLINLNDASILVMVANYWKLAGDYQNAEKFYIQAIKLDSVDPYIRYQLAEFYYSIERYDHAANTLEKGIEDVTIVPSHKILQVKSLLNLGDLKKAESCLKELRKVRPDDVETEFLSGKYNLISRNPTIAITNFEFVVKKEPKMTEGHYLLGLAYFAAGHMKLGQQSLIKALSIDHMYTDAELALADYYYKKFNYALAYEHVSRIVAREPENFRAQIIRGNILVAQEKFDSALVCFLKANMIRPNALSPHYFAAITFEKSGNEQKALNLYSDIILKNPELINVSARYVDLLIKSGNAENAKVFFVERLEKGLSCNGFIHYLLGKICLALDDFESAKSYFNKSAEINNKNSMAYLELARIYKNSGDIDDYVKALKSFIKHNDELSSTYVELASFLLNIGNEKKAIQTLSEGLIKNPDSALINNNLAFLYLSRDENVNKAFGLAQRAYREMENEPAVNDTLGWAYYKKGLYRQAEWYIREAIKLGGWEYQGAPNSANAENYKIPVPGKENESGESHKKKIQRKVEKNKEFAIAQYHLGLVLKESGDDVGAMESLEVALKVGLEGLFRSDAERVIKVIDKGADNVENYID